MRDLRTWTQQMHRSAPLIAAFAIFAFIGCASSRLPPKLSRAEHTTVEQFRLPLTVAVAADLSPAFSTRLLEDLRTTGVFTRVETLSDLPEADLVMQVDRHIDGDYVAIIPIFSILTFGVIPTSFQTEYGQAFSVRRGGPPTTTGGCEGDVVAIDFSYDGRATLGWAAALMNISTKYTLRNPRNTDRYRDGLALALAQSSDAINSLLAESSCPHGASALASTHQ